jgi:adenylate kinase family enzyme
MEWHSAEDLTWEPGWVEVPLAEQRCRIEQICERSDWILDTAYAKWLDIALERVQLIVALDYPRWVSLQRLIRRTATDVRGHFTRDAIIVWHFRSRSDEFGVMRGTATSFASSGGPPPN